jgi:putative endonuclease
VVLKRLGDFFERKALRLARKRGLLILCRNFRGRSGEIDFIALDDDQLVFVEVRRRSNPDFSSAAASVDARKQRRLILTAQLFLQQQPQWAERPCRFDVIAFEPPQSPSSSGFRWIRGAFTA